MSDPDEVRARAARPVAWTGVSRSEGDPNGGNPGEANRSAQLQAALELIDDGFTLIDQDLKLLAWNASFLRLLDFPSSLAFVGAPFEGFIRHNAQRGEYGAGDVEAQVAERVASALRFESHEFERARPDGQIIRVRGVPVPDIGFVTLYSDVTAHRRAERQIHRHAAELERRVAERTDALRSSEARMRLITDSIPALIAYFDHCKAYRYINRGYQEWFGQDPARPDLVSARRYLGDATYETIRPNVAQALAGHRVSFEYEVRCIDGRRRDARTTLIPEKTEDGTVIGCFELTFDVSELRRAQQHLAQTEKMEALGQLTGGLAHDFNNMLTVIIGNLLGLRDGYPGDDRIAEFVDPALAAARRGAELIRSLLGFARRRPLKAQAADVGPLIATVVKLLRRSLPAGLRLEADVGTGSIDDELDGDGLNRAAYDDAEGLLAWTDPNRLQDALVNLILNARDAHARTIQVRARMEALDGERASDLQVRAGPCVRIDVIDDGDGMDEATRARIFEPFFSTKGQGAGTGLGMSMVYGMVRQSDGAIEVDSTPGRGTRITLWLPEADGPGRRPASAVRQSEVRPVADYALALLVEDDPAVRRVVRRSLVELGFAVVEAENGTEALQMLDQMPQVKLLLSDIVMPGNVDGHAVARHARARQVPHVALMSGYAPESAEAAADDTPILSKPFTSRQLAEFLQRKIRLTGLAPDSNRT